MKKFIALLLSFVMIFTMAFTMIPAAIGPAALADDNSAEGTIELLYEDGSTGQIAVRVDKHYSIYDDRYYGYIVMCKYEETDPYTLITTKYAKCYAYIEGFSIPIGVNDYTDSNESEKLSVLNGNARERIDEYSQDIKHLQSTIDYQYELFDSPHHEDYDSHFPNVEYIDATHNDPPAKLCRKTRFDAQGLPCIKYIGGGKPIEGINSPSSIVMLIASAAAGLKSGLEELAGVFIESILGEILPSAVVPKYEATYDYLISYGIYDITNEHINYKDPDPNPEDPENGGYTGHSATTAFTRNLKNDNGGRDFEYELGSDFSNIYDAENFLIDELHEKHTHTFKPCSTMCTVCGFGRAHTPEYGLHTHCWTHFNIAGVGWRHVEFCSVCNVPIPSWNEAMDNFALGSEVCNCTDTGRFSTDPKHIYKDCTDTTCNVCGFNRSIYGIPNADGHMYDNCADCICNVCNHDRGLPGYAETDGHVYENCYDLTCNRTGCSYARPEPVHDLGESYLVPIGKADVCQQDTRFCMRSGCAYRQVSSTITEHTYDNCADSICNVCQFDRGMPGYLETDGHVYSDCYDLTCNRTDCDYARTKPGHIMGEFDWVPIGKADVCKEYTSFCMRPGCAYRQVTSTIADHTYDNCADSACNVCQFDRGAITGYVETDGHAYDNCYDLTCNRTECGYARSVPGHIMGEFNWVPIGKADVCQQETSFCMRPGCAYRKVTSTDSTHSYTNCADKACNVCGYDRGLPGYAETDGHVYDDCYDLTCNRTGCDYARSEPGHKMGTFRWVPIGKSNVCQEYTSFCMRSGCAYRKVTSTDTSHSYATSYVKIHTADTCRKVVKTCSVCGYSYYYYDYSHSSYSSWRYYSAMTHRRTCNDCGYAKYQNHTWVYIPGKGNYCNICSVFEQ